MRMEWLCATMAATMAYSKLVRPWHLRWGATDEELADSYPGDELVPKPQVASTRALTIKAPVEDVWPWLVQIGQGRGGFYSYMWFENLLLTRMKNADRVLPEFQHLEVGDEVRTHPKVALKVRLVEPGRSLVIGDTWGFYLQPLDAHTTRFIIRGRGMMEKPNLGPIGNFVYWRLIFEPLHFVMERGMMRGLKRRAERPVEATAREPVPVG